MSYCNSSRSLHGLCIFGDFGTDQCAQFRSILNPFQILLWTWISISLSELSYRGWLAHINIYPVLLPYFRFISHYDDIGNMT